MHSSVAVADYHTAGAPFRVVVSGGPHLDGTSMLERTDHAVRSADELRKLIVAEPRGYEAMHGCFITEPCDPAADLGAVFFNNSGFISACGHGTIALVTWAIESGFVAADEGRVVVDTPSGRTTALADVADGRVLSVAYVGPTAYVAARFIPVQLSAGVVSVDIGYGGAYLAAVSTAELDLAISWENLSRFVQIGREIGAILNENPAVEHPTDHRLSGLAGTVFYDELESVGAGLQQRSVTVFAGGDIDRSPCGTGTSARLALLDSAAELERGELLSNVGILGTQLTGRVVGDATVGGIHGVLTEVRGRAFRTGTSTLIRDEDDPIGSGYLLR